MRSANPLLPLMSDLKQTQRQEPSISSFTVDRDDREIYHRPRQTSAAASTTATPQASSGSSSWFLVLLVLLALAASGGLFYLNHQQKQQLAAAEKRVSELESRLSTTGEELDQSAVALQIKVKELANKTNELWVQMDKLWASAWRRNQSEIKALDKKVLDQLSDSRKRSQQLQTDLGQLQTQIELFAEQSQQVTSQNAQYARLLQQLQQRQQQDSKKIIALEENLVTSQTRTQLLVERLLALETWQKQQAAQATSTATATPGAG